MAAPFGLTRFTTPLCVGPPFAPYRGHTGMSRRVSIAGLHLRNADRLSLVTQLPAWPNTQRRPASSTGHRPSLRSRSANPSHQLLTPLLWQLLQAFSSVVPANRNPANLRRMGIFAQSIEDAFSRFQSLFYLPENDIFAIPHGGFR